MSKRRPNVEGMVCPNHPETAAVTRCFTCMRPACEACAVQASGEEFCSKECANNHSISQQHLDEVAGREATRRRKAMVRKLALLGILAALIAAFGFYWLKIMPKQNAKKKPAKTRRK